MMSLARCISSNSESTSSPEKHNFNLYSGTARSVLCWPTALYPRCAAITSTLRNLKERNPSTGHKYAWTIRTLERTVSQLKSKHPIVDRHILPLHSHRGIAFKVNTLSIIPPTTRTISVHYRCCCTAFKLVKMEPPHPFPAHGGAMLVPS